MKSIKFHYQIQPNLLNVQCGWQDQWLHPTSWHSYCLAFGLSPVKRLWNHFTKCAYSFPAPLSSLISVKDKHLGYFHFPIMPRFLIQICFCAYAVGVCKWAERTITREFKEKCSVRSYFTNLEKKQLTKLGQLYQRQEVLLVGWGYHIGCGDQTWVKCMHGKCLPTVLLFWLRRVNFKSLSPENLSLNIG